MLPYFGQKFFPVAFELMGPDAVDVQKSLVIRGQRVGHPNQRFIAEDDKRRHTGGIGQGFPQGPEFSKEFLIVIRIAVLAASRFRCAGGLYRGAAMASVCSPRRTGRASSVRLSTE
jgi:hypothetical protein